LKRGLKEKSQLKRPQKKSSEDPKKKCTKLETTDPTKRSYPRGKKNQQWFGVPVGRNTHEELRTSGGKSQQLLQDGVDCKKGLKNNPKPQP